jgi:hypothetical protein
MDKLDLIVDKIETLEKNQDKKLDQIQLDVDDIRSNQIEMSYDVRRNADDLVIHMKRTDLNEKRITTMEEKHEKRMASIEDKLTVGHLLKLVGIVSGGVSTIVGAAYGVIKLIDHFAK